MQSSSRYVYRYIDINGHNGHNGHNITDYEIKFLDFITKIDNIVKRELNGLDLLDVPDEDFMQLYDDHYSPDYVARMIVNDYNAMITHVFINKK